MAAKPVRNAATTKYPTGETKGLAGFSGGGPARAKATNRGKAVLAKSPPPYGGGPKGKVPSPVPAGPPAKKAPITGPMQGFRGRGDKPK